MLCAFVIILTYWRPDNKECVYLELLRLWCLTRVCRLTFVRNVDAVMTKLCDLTMMSSSICLCISCLSQASSRIGSRRKQPSPP